MTELTQPALPVLVPRIPQLRDTKLLAVACMLAPPTGEPRIQLVGMTRVLPNTPLSAGTRPAQQLSGRLQALARNNTAYELFPQRIVAHDLWPALQQTILAADLPHALLLLPWRADGLYAGINLESALEMPPCNIALVNPPKRGSRLRRILLPVRGGSYAVLGAELAIRMARHTGARITLLHVHADDANDASQRSKSAELYSEHEEFAEHLHATGDPLKAVLRELDRHQAIIVGASARAGEPLSVLARNMLARNDVLTMVVRTKSPFVLQSAEENKTSRQSVTARVNRWFAENTFHSTEFADIGRLIDLKRKQNLSISLGLPALNEAATVGKVMRTIKAALMDDAPLLDEIVLVDSNSTDATRKIAEECNVPWVIHQRVLPLQGARRGKGEALWKSLHVLRGDLIAWIDTDITNIHPRFVYGVLGPLLVNPALQYVKGFYQRPIRIGDRVQASGGGRVTELLARPLINMFYPELSGLAQPLSGEYAGRRTALENVPFFCGYGVEVGLLLALHQRHGLAGLAQTDLEERVHRNQELESLGKMSFALLQVFMDHLVQSGRAKIEAKEIDRTLKVLRADADSYFLEEIDILERQRPPIATLPEYFSRQLAK